MLFFTKHITAKIIAEYEEQTRSSLLQATLSADWPYLTRQKVGYLDQILTTNIRHSSALLFYMSSGILILTNFIVYSLIAINISLAIALVALALGGMIFLIFKPLLYRNAQAAKEVEKKHKQLAHYINEHIIGMKTVKAMFAEQEVLKSGLNYFRQLKDFNIHIAFLQNITAASMHPVGLVFIIGIFAFFYKTAAFSFVSFVVIVYAINKVFTSIQMAQGQAHLISTQIPYLVGVLDYQKEANKHMEADAGTHAFSFGKSLDVTGINFSYDPTEQILSNITFSVGRGEMLGLIGPSGAGKTTLVDLLLRLLNPKTGSILLDGVDISDIRLEEWRTNVGYVSQDIFLINDTIENNIKFYDASLTHKEIIEAARLANIHEFIERLPDQYETIVGERGIRLSGGQRQRIVLARALARKPQILILDEATSALDNESEIAIQKAIEKMRGDITVIAIAHRLSTVMASDTLAVLEGGTMIEQGAPADLLKDKNSYFFKTYHVRK